MRCRSALTRIDAMRTKELHAEEHGALKDHLSTCASCDESVTDVEQLARAVKSLVIAPPRSLREVVKPDFFDQVGDVWVAFSDRAIKMISGRSLADLRSHYTKRYGRTLERAPIPEPLRPSRSWPIRLSEGFEAISLSPELWPRYAIRSFRS